MTSTSIISNLLRLIDPAGPKSELPQSHDLDKGEIYSIYKPAGCQIQCSSGLVWVTQDEDPQDILLEAGEGYRPQGNSRVLVQALRAASVTTLR